MYFIMYFLYVFCLCILRMYYFEASDNINIKYDIFYILMLDS